jgi:aryl-alcohol dehydrogenase-like predicted oxidoreductase
MAAGTITLGGELTVNRMGFGAMRLTGDGVWGPPADRDEARRVLHRAIELGVNFIDTADSYGPHAADEIIAETLAPYPRGVVIATKAGFERPGPGQWVTNGRPDHLRASCDASLRRLRVDRIDLFQLHRVDSKVPEADQFGTLAELRAAGKIRLAGLSEVDVDTIARARQVVPIASVQNKYNVADRSWEPVVNYCDREAIAFIPWYPLAAGALSAEVLDRVAARHDATRWQAAIAWLLARSPIMLPIPGTSKVRHLEENIAAASIELSAADLRELNQIAGG